MPGLPTQPPPTSNPILQGKTPWYQFPRIDNFGTKDSQGDYWKPDSNIQLPGLYPITALLPGTVTSVQTTAWGQSVITIKLDTPLNTIATHTFYEHLNSSTVSVGQHVSGGDLIGYNNPLGFVPLGFGLYPGDVYGSGPAWNQLQTDLAPGGAGLLNPVNLLNMAQKGNLTNNLIGSYNQSITGNCAPWDIQCLVQNLQGVGVKIGLFVIALFLVVLGGIVLIHPDVEGDAGKIAKAAILA